MKRKSLLVLFSLLFQTALIFGQSPIKYNLASSYDNKLMSDMFQGITSKYANVPIYSSLGSTGNNAFIKNCDENELFLAPNAQDCNGATVTAINFNNTGRTVVGGTNNTVGVVYRYPNAGIAPDGRAVDARVTVVSYSNNQDTNTSNFSDSDTPGATFGFEQNLQPNINQESATYSGATTWSGSIQYRIAFVVAGTTTPIPLTVAATSVDNDGASAAENGCAGALRESVTYSAGTSQILINTPNNPGTTQTVSGNTVQGPATNQAGIGIGSQFANAALLVNVSEFNWTHSFNAPNGTCTSTQTSPGRFGSLNLACQIIFNQKFGLSGTVFNDTNGLNGTPVNTVDGTGIGAPSGAQLYANLLDSANNVIATAVVAADGRYNIPTASAGTYKVQISTNQGTVNSPAPVQALPTGWASTGEFFGNTAGNDGTKDGLLTVTVGNVAVSFANFGIEQRPTANNNTATSRLNPGGTTSSTVAPATFSGTDPITNTVSSIRITALPTNATSITINGTLYGAGGTAFPTGGITVPTNAGGNPTQPILVDPVDGAVTVVISYVAIDEAGVESTSPATASVPFTIVSLSGTVFNDTNGLSGTPANTVGGTGTGTPSGTQLYANLLRGNTVVASVAVTPASGAYSFAGVDTGSYTVQISTNEGTPGNSAPVKALPTGWVNTGENLGAGAGSDGTPDGLLAVTVGTGDVSNANFGIEQRPTANNNTAVSQVNPGGTTNATVPATTFSGTDPVTNTVSSIRITALPTNATSITINGTLYGAGGTAFPAGGVIIPTNAAGNPTQPILVDPVDGAVTVIISYVAIDEAGIESTSPATASVPFSTVSLSGTIFNDANGLNGTPVNTVDGTGTGTLGGTQLYANLLRGTTIVASVAVTANTGAYTFSGVNGGVYSVQISTNQGTPGNTAPVRALPTGWVNTGENLGAGAGSDGTSDGSLAVTVNNGDVTNANFGVEERPTATSKTSANNNNTGGVNFTQVPPTTFSATDVSPGMVSSIRITSFPTNADSIIINGVQYDRTGGNPFPANGIIVPTNAAGNPTQTILVDPIDGSVSVEIPYVAIDNAGIESASPATATVPFTVGTTSASVEISGSLLFGGNPLRNVLVSLYDPSINSTVFVRTDNNGRYIFEREVGKTYVIVPMNSKYQFSPASKVINLITGIQDADFNSSAKNYHPKNDFDGDGKSDIAVFRPENGVWYILASSDNVMRVSSFGQNGDVPVSGDFDGDGKADVAVFRPENGVWYIQNSSDGAFRAEAFGLGDDKLVPGDYDGDGKSDIAVYRNGYWYILKSSDGSFKAVQFGTSEDIPVTQDFDGDNKTDLMVYRPSNATWYLTGSRNNGFSATKFGIATDVPMVGDYDGDGRADIAQFRNGNWYVLNSATGFEAIRLGSEQTQSISGDYDGDGRADTTVFNDGNWTIRNSGSGVVSETQFGLQTDILVK